MRLIIQNKVPEHQLAWLEINIARRRQQCHLNSYSKKFQLLPTSLLLVSTVQQKVEGLAQFSMKRSRGDKAHFAGLQGKRPAEYLAQCSCADNSGGVTLEAAHLNKKLKSLELRRDWDFVTIWIWITYSNFIFLMQNKQSSNILLSTLIVEKVKDNAHMVPSTVSLYHRCQILIIANLNT